MFIIYLQELYSYLYTFTINIHFNIKCLFLTKHRTERSAVADDNKNNDELGRLAAGKTPVGTNVNANL